MSLKAQEWGYLSDEIEKKRSPVSRQLCHDKDPSPLKDQKREESSFNVNVNVTLWMKYSWKGVIQHKSINQSITIHVIYRQDEVILQIKIFAMINVFNPLITLKPIYNVLSSKIESILTSLCMLCFAEINMKCSYMHIWVNIKMILYLVIYISISINSIYM